MLYFLRHSLELIIKAYVIKNNSYNDAMQIIIKNRHSLFSLFQFFDKTTDEYSKIESIFSDVDEFDSESNLFRYPFKKDFLEKYRNKNLDVLKMSEVLVYCYYLLYKKMFNKSILNIESIKLCKDSFDETNQYIIISKTYSNCCYLWQNNEIDPYNQIQGYEYTCKILWCFLKENNEMNIVLPLLYSLRHVNELACKDVVNTVGWPYHELIKNTINQDLKRGFIPGHSFNKILKQTNIVINAIKYFDSSIEKENLFFQNAMKHLGTIDKNGDFFRYPISNGGSNYSYDLDIEIFISTYISTLKFLTSISNCVDIINEYQCEDYNYNKSNI